MTDEEIIETVRNGEAKGLHGIELSGASLIIDHPPNHPRDPVLHLPERAGGAVSIGPVTH